MKTTRTFKNLMTALLLGMLLLVASTGCGGGGGNGDKPDVVTPQARLSVSGSPINATADVGGVSATPTFTILNRDATRSNNYTISVDVDWITLSRTSGTLIPNSSATITATMDCAEEGTRSSTVVVNGSSSTSDRLNIAVSLECLPPPKVLTLSTLNIAVTGILGQTNAEHTFTLTNTDAYHSNDYYISSNVDWINISSTTGTIALNSSTTNHC